MSEDKIKKLKRYVLGLSGDKYNGVNIIGISNDIGSWVKFEDVEKIFTDNNVKPTIDSTFPMYSSKLNCIHKRRSSEFMGNGWLTTCIDCGEVI